MADQTNLSHIHEAKDAKPIGKTYYCVGKEGQIFKVLPEKPITRIGGSNITKPKKKRK